MSQRILIGIALLLASLTLSASAQQEQPAIEITAAVSRDTIRIGDTVVLTIKAEGAQEFELLRVEPNPKLGVFEIQQVLPVEEKKLKGKRWQKTYGYVLSTFDVGEFEIPPFTVFYKDAEGNEKTAETQPMKIVVESMVKTAEEKIDVRDIKPPLGIEARRPWLAIISGAAAVLLIVGGLLYYLRRRALARALQPEEEYLRRPIEEIAYEELDQLVSSDLVGKGELKLYYIRLSEIVRVYLGRRYRIPAMDMTSFELLNALEGRVSAQVWEGLGKFTEECDLVKFAKYRPPAERPLQMGEEARELIRLTTPEPVVAEQAVAPKEG